MFCCRVGLDVDKPGQPMDVIKFYSGDFLWTYMKKKR